MKKHLLGLAVLGTLGLAGCGGDGPAEPTESPLPPGIALTKAVFDKDDADGDGYKIPLPNDLLYADTTDLTLNIPGVSDANLPLTLADVVAQASDPTAGSSRGSAALSKLDGWSTVAPFTVKFKNENPSVGLDGESVVAGETVRLFEVTTARAVVKPGATEAETIRAPTGPVSGVVAEVSADDFAVEVAADCELEAADCAELTSGKSKTKQYVRVIPKKALKFGTAYLVVYTNGIKDNNGTPVVADAAYGVAKSLVELPPEAAAYALQKFVVAQESAVVAQGMARDSIVLSQLFTTQSRSVMTVGVPGVMNNAMVKAVITGVGSPTTKPTFAKFAAGPYAGYPIALGLENFLPTAPGANKASVLFGEVMVPYFSKPATSALFPVTGVSLDPGPVLESWKATLTMPGLAADQVCSIEHPEYCNPFCGITASDTDTTFAVKAQRCNTNYALPVPRLQGSLQGFERVPMLVITPSATSGCPKPEAGWPTVIFQHGITGNRTNALGFGIAAANACHAIVAIDQPLHGIAKNNAFSVGVKAATDAATGGNGFEPFKGYAVGGARERTFGIDLMDCTGSPFSGATGSDCDGDGTAEVPPDGVPGDGTVDSSGSWFINLYSMGSTRDNLRQAAVDLMALKLAIPAMDYDGNGTPDFDGSRLTAAGISLGGIAVTTFSALDQIAAPYPYPGSKLKASVLNVPGGGLAKMLDGSMAFGPKIRAGLKSGGVVAGTLGYETFLWLSQTLVDSGDPLNYADILAGASDYPVLVQEVAGTGPQLPNYTVGEDDVPSDLVVPNATKAMTVELNPVYPAGPLSGAYTVYSDGPLAGTEPLIKAVGVTATSTPVPLGETPIRAAIRFAVGHHAVLLSADANGDGTDEAAMISARSEMQTQAMTFLAYGGYALPISGVGTLVRPAE